MRSWRYLSHPHSPVHYRTYSVYSSLFTVMSLVAPTPSLHVTIPARRVKCWCVKGDYSRVVTCILPRRYSYYSSLVYLPALYTHTGYHTLSDPHKLLQLCSLLAYYHIRQQSPLLLAIRIVSPVHTQGIPFPLVIDKTFILHRYN